MGDAVELEYVGFWLRVWASVIDTVLVTVLIVPILLAVYGQEYFLTDAVTSGPAEFLISWVLPAVVVVIFWHARHATPGKMAISARIVDEKSGGAPSLGQHIGRYLAYYVSLLPLGLGFIWVAFDPKKQGWHDKLAGTVVVRPRRAGAAPVHFGS